MSKPNMRDAMPQAAAFIDHMRQAFGREMIDGQIKRGMRDEAVFFASENGHRLGRMETRPTFAIRNDERGISYVDLPGWVEWARRVVDGKGIEIRRARTGDAADIEREVNELREFMEGQR